MKKMTRNFLWSIALWILGLLSLILLGLSIYFLCKVDDSTNHVAVLLQSCIMGFTALVALRTYLQSRRIENAKAILEIRKVLASEDNKMVHQHIGEKNDMKETKGSEYSEEFQKFWTDNKYKIYDYLGTLEALNIFIQEDVLDQDDFKNQFGYRLKNIIKYEDLLKKIEKQHQHYPGWKDLIELLEIADNNYHFHKNSSK